MGNCFGKGGNRISDTTANMLRSQAKKFETQLEELKAYAKKRMDKQLNVFKTEIKEIKNEIEQIKQLCIAVEKRVDERLSTHKTRAKDKSVTKKTDAVLHPQSTLPNNTGDLQEIGMKIYLLQTKMTEMQEQMELLQGNAAGQPTMQDGQAAAFQTKLVQLNENIDAVKNYSEANIKKLFAAFTGFQDTYVGLVDIVSQIALQVSEE